MAVAWISRANKRPPRRRRRCRPLRCQAEASSQSHTVHGTCTKAVGGVRTSRLCLLSVACGLAFGEVSNRTS